MIIAQLSDIHADGSREALERLDRVLAWLAPMRADALIVSGDLAEDNHRDSYRQVRKRLDALGVPFQVVPGNVDGHAELVEVFGDIHAWAHERPLNSSMSVGTTFRVIGLDVTVADAHHGDAEPVLRWLGDELAKDDTPALIFQHQHPFLCGIDGKDFNICHNAASLAAVIVRAGDRVIGVTCGHVHRPMFTLFAGRPATMAPSVARANRLKLDGRESSISDPPGLLLHHWRDGRLVTHAVSVS